MTSPYRTSSRPSAEADDEPRELGPLRSRHPPTGPRALVSQADSLVDVHTGGLVIWDGPPGGTEILFEDIDAVYFDFETVLASPPHVTLVTFDARRVVIARHAHDLPDVIAAIDREVTWPILARAKEALARGEILTFGPVVLELDGIVLGGERLAWTDLSYVAAESDTLVFYAREPLGRHYGWVRIRDIPHPRVLLALLRIRGRVEERGLRL